MTIAGVAPDAFSIRLSEFPAPGQVKLTASRRRSSSSSRTAAITQPAATRLADRSKKRTKQLVQHASSLPSRLIMPPNRLYRCPPSPHPAEQADSGNRQQGTGSGSGTVAAVPPTALPPPPCDSGGAAAERRHAPDVFSSPPSVAGADAAALGGTAPEPTGDEAASKAPMPAPLPKTNRPPAAIVTNPLPASGQGAAMSSVPPLTVVPPVYAFVPLRVDWPLPEKRQRIVADDVPGERRRAGGRGHRERRENNWRRGCS